MSDIAINRMVDIPTLMSWRKEVLRFVFSIPENEDMTELEKQNRLYYERHLTQGSHIACLAYVDGEVVGCGGVCLYDEMPSPDNPSGRCVYLMNIYVREPFRKRGVGKEIVRWLTGEAQKQNMTKIYLETSNMARSLYSDLGFQEMEDMMKWTQR